MKKTIITSLPYFFLEDTKDIQQRSTVKIFADQVHKRDPCTTGLVSTATLVTTTNTTYSKSALA